MARGEVEEMVEIDICCVKSSGGFLPSDFDGQVVAVRRGIVVFKREAELDSKHILKVWGIVPQEYGVARIPLVDAVIGRFSDNVGVVATFTRRYHDGFSVTVEGVVNDVSYRFTVNPDVLKLVDADKLFAIIDNFVKRAFNERAGVVVEKVLEALVEYAINAINVDDIEGCLAARIPKRIGRNLNPLWVLCEAVRLARLMA